MRTLTAAVLAVSLIACAKKAPYKTQVRLDAIEISDTYQFNRSAPGNTFAIARVTEDPAPPEFRPLTECVMEDWDGNHYKVRWGNGFRGQNGDKLDPDRMEIVFEIPKTATPRSLTIPEKLEAPVFRPTKEEERPKLVQHADPKLPAGRQPTSDDSVKLDVFVAADGHVGGAALVSGPADLANAARQAVREWRYEPAQVNGKPVAAVVQETVKFQP